MIGRLLYKSGSNKLIEKSSSDNVKNIVGHVIKPEVLRQNRNLNSKFRRNSTNPLVNLLKSKVRLRRENTALPVSTTAFVTPMVVINGEIDETINSPRAFDASTLRPRSSQWRPVTPGRKNASYEVPDISLVPKPLFPQRRIFKNSTETSTPKKRMDNPLGLRFHIANQPDVAGKITITDDGTLITLAGLDREARDVYRLTIIAEYSKGFTSGAGIYQVNVFVDDVNDNPPIFDAPIYTGMILENSAIGSTVNLNRAIKISDADLGVNSQFNVSILGEGKELFAIEYVNNTSNSTVIKRIPPPEVYEIDKNASDMQLLLLHPNFTYIDGPYFKVKFIGKSRLDREKDGFYSLNILAKDSGGLSTSARLNIFIGDINDNAPIFERISVFKEAGVEVLEYSNDMEISFVESVPMEDPIGLEYSIPGSPRLSGNTSDLSNRLSRSFRKELPTNRPKQRAPRKQKSCPLFSVLEDVHVGKTLIKLTAIDEDYDKNAQVFYEVFSENTTPLKNSKRNKRADEKIRYFNIDRISGELKVNHPLEANIEVYINLTAKDIGNLFDETCVRFRVVDVNNHSPVFKRTWYSFDLQEGEYFDQSIDQLEASDEDYGQNANITYEIQDARNIPFKISPRSGVLKANGDLDRETKAQYEFVVVAIDNGQPKRLSGSVEVEINVLDVNDNAPEFIGYDDLQIKVEDTSERLDMVGRKMLTDENLNKIESIKKMPVYKAYLDRSTVPGTFVRQITAIDKDYAGNGNGLVMYSLQHHKLPHSFEIDSRDGIINTIARFSQYNGYEHINLTIIASDLGNPSKSSMALLVVNLQGPDVINVEVPPLFKHRYYELEVKENNMFPSEIIQINVTSEHFKEQFRWTIVIEDDDYVQDTFQIDAKSGKLYVLKQLDREEKDFYSVKLRADKVNTREGRYFATMTYPIGSDRLSDLMENEVRVTIRVTDDNDNSPRFKGNGRPIVAVIPRNVNFGYPVTQMIAVDDDIGKNAEIRYKLLNEPTKLFGIDDMSGKIRVLGPIGEEQKVFGFDVKATDRRGEDDGRSSIANVFVYVLEDNKSVRLVIAGKPVEVERDLESLTDSLSAATGVEVRVRLLEPHIGGDEPS